MCTTCGCGEGNLYIEGDERNPHSAFRSAPFAPAPRQTMTITGVKTDHFAPHPHAGRAALRPPAGTPRPGSQRRMLEVEIDVLDKNNRLAARNRARFAAKQQLVLNLVSSPARQNHPAHRKPHRLKRTPTARRFEGDRANGQDAARIRVRHRHRRFRSIPGKACHL